MELQEIISPEWKKFVEQASAYLLVSLGGAGVFILAKVRDWFFISMQNSIRKKSRLRPGTAAGHKAINQELSDLRRTLDAFRICVYQFHNGDNFMLSNHSWKVSCTHEVLDPGARSTFRETQSLPVSHVADWVGPIVDTDLHTRGVHILNPASPVHERVLVFDVGQLEISAARVMAQDQGVGSTCAVALHDRTRKAVFGYISIQFQDVDNAILAQVETKLAQILEIAGRVQFHLTDDFRSFDRKSLMRRLHELILRP